MTGGNVKWHGRSGKQFGNWWKTKHATTRQPGNCTQRHFSHRNEQNEILIQATTWTTLQGIIRGKTSQPQNDRLHDYIRSVHFKIIVIIQVERRLTVARV